MHSLLQSFKDSKRRIAQKVRAATGLSSHSSDDEFETLYIQYEEVVKSLTWFIEYSKSFEKNLEKWCETNLQLSEKLENVISTSQPIDTADVSDYHQSVIDIHAFFKNEYEYVLQTISYFIQHRIIDRLDKFIKEGTHNVDVLYKQRKNILLDYDSHLRKVSMFESKNETDQANRFQMKANHDKAMLDEFSNYLFKRLSEFISIGSKLLITEMASLVSCELYFTKQQFDAFATIGNNIGEENVSPIINDLDVIFEQVSQKESRITYNPPSINIASYPENEYPVLVSFNDYIKTIKDPEKDQKSSDNNDHNIGMKVKAINNWKGEEDGELAFKKGDVIIVTHFFEGGWWEGECHGNTGIFPANYVESLNLYVYYNHDFFVKMAVQRCLLSIEDYL